MKHFKTNGKIKTVSTIKYIQNSLSLCKIEIKYSSIMLYSDPFSLNASTPSLPMNNAHLRSILYLKRAEGFNSIELFECIIYLFT